MARFQSWIDRSFCCCLIFLVGCTVPQGYIKADNIRDLVGQVSDRHDRYVQTDESLTQLEKSVFLQSTELLKAILEEAK